ncbi:2Fe-2S iron-sulfur cluster-binding protein [Alteromonas sp. M12]|uniref:2Fe-2S iron-sulfur cluster-binding protein n=1 Tax=Alteromonas sp. M12 TaxID=3135644 RepID=UPI00319E7965
MIEIKFISSSQESVQTSGHEGQTLMELAIENNIEGIDADCGGACACATCHVHVKPAWKDCIGGPNEAEADLLDFEENVDEFSRLSCQITLTDEMNGAEFVVDNS